MSTQDERRYVFDRSNQNLPEQQEAVLEVRSMTAHFVDRLIALTPNSAERANAIKTAKDMQFWAIDAISHRGLNSQNQETTERCGTRDGDGSQPEL